MRSLKIIFIALALFAVNIFAQESSTPLRNGIEWGMSPGQVKELEDAQLISAAGSEALVYTTNEDGVACTLMYHFRESKLVTMIKNLQTTSMPFEKSFSKLIKLRNSFTQKYGNPVEELPARNYNNDEEFLSLVKNDSYGLKIAWVIKESSTQLELHLNKTESSEGIAISILAYSKKAADESLKRAMLNGQ